MPERFRLFDAICIRLMLLLLCAAPQSSLSTISAASTVGSQMPIVVVLGLANSINNDVKRAIDTELGDKQLIVIDLADQPMATVDWPEQGLVVAVGVAGCEQTAMAAIDLDVRCVLLTEESFRTIKGNESLPVSRALSALVIDQPITRQAQVAQRVYPALSRFAVLSKTLNAHSAQDTGSFLLNRARYRPFLPLAPQLNDALASNDALIAIPENSVFNRTTLRTVLLTAYGYGKPVIGLSRAYVKAGALITAYSTPAHVFREIAENLNVTIADPTVTNSSPTVSYPQYFSIADNVNVAKSLRLTKLFPFDSAATFTDQDLQP